MKVNESQVILFTKEEYVRDFSETVVYCCPICKRMPKLLKRKRYDKAIMLQYRCTRWFGLKICFIGAAPIHVYPETFFSGVLKAKQRWNIATTQLIKG